MMKKLLVLLLLQQQQAASNSTIEYLPGLKGRLPFHLETGYVGIGKDEELQLFYYFLESESEPTTDPLLIWLSGGPGCSSLINAIVNEIGPLRFAEQVYNGSLPSFVLNPHAWTKWLSDHLQFISNSFYVSGNSYSGMTIPIITQLISNGNAEGKEPLFNLQSLEKNCRGEYTNIDPNNTGCASDFRTFKQMISNINTEHILRPTCGANAIIQGPRKLSGQRKLQNDKLISLQRGDPCAFDWRKLVKYWANDPEVQEALHVRKGIIGSWMRCRRSIYMSSDNYTLTVNNVIPYHANLSTKDYRSLIYSGDHDYMIPFQSTQVWIKSLNYSINDDWRPWNVNNQVAGYTRSYSNKMTYATVKGAGHTAGSYKPEECFAMFKRWISHEPL